MQIFLKTVTGLWVAFWLFMAGYVFVFTPEQIQKDQDFIKTKLKPSVDFVKTFKRDHNRLPSQEEYSQSFNNNDAEYVISKAQIVTDDHDKVKSADWTKDYAIAVWRGEWFEYYFSWTDSYDSNNYTWTDGFAALGVLSGIGIFPLVLLWFGSWRRKKSKLKFAKG